MERLAPRLSQLHRDQRGNVAMIFALTAVAIVSLTGLAIDFQNTVRQKGRVQQALDSAVLSGALLRQSGASPAEVTSEVRTYVQAQIDSEDDGLSCNPVRVTLSDADQDISGAISCSQKTYLSMVMGKRKMDFSVNATSTYGVGLLDVAFIFDVSGSMNSNGRLDALKESAKIAFDELLPDNVNRNGEVRIGIVTYNHALNAGDVFNKVTRRVRLRPDTSNTQARRRYNRHNDARMIDRNTGKRFFYYENSTCTERRSRNCNQYGRYEWDAARHFYTDSPGPKTCVFERVGADAYTDARPARDKWIGAGNPFWLFNTNSYYKYYGELAVERYGANAWYYGAFQGKYVLCENSGPLPLTDNKADLNAYVDALHASGGTAGQLGIAWGWYMVSPEWAPVWGANAAPLPYDTPDLAKAVILMTDGDFNTSHPNAAEGSFQQSQALCDAMKARPGNIQIYTVGFQVPNNVQTTANGRTILEYCATSPGHAFDADNAQELEDAYRAIARSISDLRIKN